MAAVADYKHADQEEGIYGIYNPFFVRITRTGGTVYKLKYRIKVTTLEDSKEYVRDVDPISEVSFVNPVSILQDAYFKTQYIGNDDTSPIDVSTGVAQFSYSDVKIEIGQVSSTSATTPPTFGGYDTDDTFYFYGGFEDSLGGEVVSNYRDPNWYDTLPIKLPTVKTLLYRREYDDYQMICLPNFIEHNTGPLNIANIIVTYFANDGTLQSSVTTSIAAYVSGLGYWYINLESFTALMGTASNDYAEVYFEYEDLEPVGYATEVITIRFSECQPKNSTYKLAWINRYAGIEYQIFPNLGTKTIAVTSGKQIINDGINRSAATFGLSYNENEPKLKPYGKEGTTEYTIVTDWLTESEQDALRDAYESPKVYMFNEDNEIIPLIVMDNTYRITDVNNELFKVTMRVRVASPNKTRNQ